MWQLHILMNGWLTRVADTILTIFIKFCVRTKYVFYYLKQRNTGFFHIFFQINKKINCTVL